MATCAALLAGCSSGKKDEQIASLQGQVKTLEASVKQSNQRNDTLQEQVTDLDGKLRDAQGEADDLRVKLERANKDSDPEQVARLQKRIGKLVKL